MVITDAMLGRVTAEYPARLKRPYMNGSYHADLQELWLTHGPEWPDVVKFITEDRRATPGGWSRGTKAFGYFVALVAFANDMAAKQRWALQAAKDCKEAKGVCRASLIRKLLPQALESNELTADELLAALVALNDDDAKRAAEHGNWHGMNKAAALAHAIETFRQSIA